MVKINCGKFRLVTKYILYYQAMQQSDHNPLFLYVRSILYENNNYEFINKLMPNTVLAHIDLFFRNRRHRCPYQRGSRGIDPTLISIVLQWQI